jgi:hypothetical protein
LLEEESEPVPVFNGVILPVVGVTKECEVLNEPQAMNKDLLEHNVVLVPAESIAIDLYDINYVLNLLQ